MRFYYLSIISIILLLLIWSIGTWLLVRYGARLKKTRKRVWPVMVPLFLLLYLGPIAEELVIARNFDRLCKQDAGIFVYKTVEVDGFYDDTTHWWRQLAESGYQWMESRDNTFGGLFRVERDGDGLRHFEIDKPTARYHYKWPEYNFQIGHKLFKQSETVVDTESGEVLAGSNGYGRKSPWFFIGLDDPGMSCPRPGEDPLKRPGLLYKHVLLPATSK